MLINLITPVSRPYNLCIIERTLNLPLYAFRWIVVYDNEEIPVPYSHPLFESYCIKDEKSISGNAQRNLALSKVKDGWIYFMDDDTIIHKDFWRYINSLEFRGHDFASFMQENKDGTLRLKGDNVSLNNIDSGNFIFHSSLLGDTRWVIDRYDADGVFAEEIYKKAKNPLYIPKILSTYNALK